MAYRFSLARARKARPSSIVAKSVAALALSAVIYGFAVPGTGGFRAVDLNADLPPTPLASLSFENDAPIIDGTVASLFQTEMFSGVNRTTKTARAQPDVNIADFTQSFDAIRLSIANARSEGALTYGQSAVQVAEGEQADEATRISVASINPASVASDGLDAIGAATGAFTPGSLSVPDTLAYGRANTPATDFTAQHTYSEREQWCLSTGIYFEARGESYRGQVAVAQVIMNRVEDHRYPDTICGVVYQNQHRRNACQFSFACDGVTNVNRTPEVAAWQRAQEITQTVLNEEIYLAEVGDATHYHATYVRPHWARNMDRVSQIGLHIFYRFKPGWRFG